MAEGVLVSIWIGPKRHEPLIPVTEVMALEGKGLEGDRYAASRGSLSRWPGAARQVSLIEQESLMAVNQEIGIDLSDGRSRRNLVTCGVPLALFKGRFFRIGGVVLRGVGLCQPCAYLERLTVSGAFAALKGRGGLRAEVLRSGLIQAGARIELLPESFKSVADLERFTVREDSNHGHAQSRERPGAGLSGLAGPAPDQGLANQ